MQFTLEREPHKFYAVYLRLRNVQGRDGHKFHEVYLRERATQILCSLLEIEECPRDVLVPICSKTKKEKKPLQPFVN